METLRIGPRLRAARLSRYLTHQALGEAIGLSARSVMRREQETTTITPTELRAWAETTGADPRWLLDLGGEPPVMGVQA